MDIGSKIKEHRNKQGLTQVELANKANISRSYLADVEKNRYNASVETLTAIASALNVPMSILLDEKLYEWDEKYNKDEFLVKEVNEIEYGINKAKKIAPDLDIVPEQFTIPSEARAYISKHRIFSSEGFDVNKLTDDEVLEFSNALLEQMKMVSYKYKK